LDGEGGRITSGIFRTFRIDGFFIH
jgi:hypothetical protein